MVARRGALPLEATGSGGSGVRREDHLSRRETLSPFFRRPALGKGEERQKESSPGAMVGAGGGLALEQEGGEEYVGDGGSG